MNDNKLSTNLSTINTAVSKIRTSLNASNLDINKLADRVVEVKTSLSNLENNMVYEVRLKDAINKGWLVPFRYYGIYDETVNYEDIDYKNDGSKIKKMEETKRGFKPLKDNLELWINDKIKEITDKM